MRSYYQFGLAYPIFAMVIGLSSCSEDKFAHDTTSERWQQTLNGESDKAQDWLTAINMQLDIVANKGNIVSAYSIGNEKPILLARQEMMGNGVIRLDVPQGIGNSIGLVCDTPNGRRYQRVFLSGEKKQIEDVNFNNNGNTSSAIFSDEMKTRKKSATRVIDNTADTPLPAVTGTHNSSLNGNSVAPLNGYNSFGGWAWEALLEALPEMQLAELHNTADGLNYEFTSDGYQGKGVYGDNTIISLAYLYGYTGNTSSCVFGYYTHTDGTFSDIQLHDLGEVFTKDYLASPNSTDYYAKVQYQLDGVEKWYDANFYNYDGEGILSRC